MRALSLRRSLPPATVLPGLTRLSSLSCLFGPSRLSRPSSPSGPSSLSRLCQLTGGVIQPVPQRLRPCALVGEFLRLAIPCAAGRRELVRDLVERAREVLLRRRQRARVVAGARGGVAAPTLRLGRRAAHRIGGLLHAIHELLPLEILRGVAGRSLRLRARGPILRPGRTDRSSRSGRGGVCTSRLLFQRILQLARALGEALLLAREAA